MNDLIVGAWRNGVGSDVTDIVDEAYAKQKSGFRQFPNESTVRELAELLDSYDEVANELLTATTMTEAMTPLTKLVAK